MKRCFLPVKPLFFLFSFSLLLLARIDAQVIEKANKANRTINGATNTVTDTKNTLKQAKEVFGNLFKRKKKKNKGEGVDSTAKELKVTFITIANIDYPSLKIFEDSLQAIKGVDSVKKTFNVASSVIAVSFSGESDELWDLIPGKLREWFDLKALADRKIMVEFKKPS